MPDSIDGQSGWSIAGMKKPVQRRFAAQARLPSNGPGEFTDAIAGTGRYLTSGEKLTHQRASQGVAPVPSLNLPGFAARPDQFHDRHC